MLRRVTPPLASLAVGIAVLVLAAGGTLASRPTTVCYRVNTTNDTVDVNPGDGVCADADGKCSLRAAVQEANASGEPAVIVLRSDRVYSLTTLLGRGEDASAVGDLDITGDVTIRGGGRLSRVWARGVRVNFNSGAILNADGLDRIFDVHEGGRLSLIGVRFTGGNASDGGGGAIRTSGTLRFVRSMIVASSTRGTGSLGGGIFNDGGTLTVIDSEFRNLTALDGGGMIASRGGVTTIDRCYSFGSLATEGGGIHVSGDGTVSIRRSTLVSASARRGGGIWNSSTGTKIDRCVFDFNSAGESQTASDGGGAIFNAGGSLEVTRSRFVLCQTAGFTDIAATGGGILNVSGALTVRGCAFLQGEANGAGGGIAARGGEVAITRTRFVDNGGGRITPNGPDTGGGGLYVSGDADVTVDRCRFARNSTGADGGAIAQASGTLTTTGTTLRLNLAADGGGLSVRGGTAVVEKSRIVGNLAGSPAAGTGAGVRIAGGSLTLRRCVVARNLCGRVGGGIEVAGSGDVTLEDVTLRRNRTVEGDGGGLHVGDDGSVTVTNGAFLRNRAGNEGGGIWNSPTGTIVVTGARIRRNRAPLGRDLFNAGGTFTIDGEDVPIGE